MDDRCVCRSFCNDSVCVMDFHHLESVHAKCDAVVKDGRIPEDWSKSWLVNVYKGKGDSLACSSYRSIVLIEL